MQSTMNPTTSKVHIQKINATITTPFIIVRTSTLRLKHRAYLQQVNTSEIKRSTTNTHML